MIKVRLARAQLKHGDGPGGIDITRKSGKGLGLLFAPTWDMVMQHKKGCITDEEYTRRYLVQLEKIPAEAFTKLHQHGLWNGGLLVLYCYCPDRTFCHTYLLMSYLASHWGDSFTLNL
jgi:hypothetical protein